MPFTLFHLGPGALVFVSAAIGVYSHVALDSLMHPDQLPFYPFTEANPMLKAVSLEVLHLFCVLTGLAAAGIGLVQAHRSRRKPNNLR